MKEPIGQWLIEMCCSEIRKLFDLIVVFVVNFFWKQSSLGENNQHFLFSIIYMAKQIGGWNLWLRELWPAVCDRLLHPEGINSKASPLLLLLHIPRAVRPGQAPGGSRRPALPAQRRGLDRGSLRCRGGQAAGAPRPSLPARCHGHRRPLRRHSPEARGHLWTPGVLQVLGKVSIGGRSRCGCSEN